MRLASVPVVVGCFGLVAGGCAQHEPGGALPSSPGECSPPDLTPVSASARWTEVGRPTTHRHRFGQSVTVLESGLVLAAGGHTWDEVHDPAAVDAVSAGAELFDPGTLTWAPTAALQVARSSHRTTALADGRALVTGGQSRPRSGWTAIGSAELFDPMTQTWRLTTAMNEPRTDHAQVRLPDGRVWVAGGSRAQAVGTKWLDSVEVFDPVDETWTSWAPLSMAEPRLSAMLLDDGRILVMGSFHVELYDPAFGSEPAPPEPPAYQHPEPYLPNVPITCVTPGIGHATALVGGGAHILALQMSLILERHGDADLCRSLLAPDEMKRRPVGTLALSSERVLFAFDATDVALLDLGTGALTAISPLIHQERGTFHLLLLNDGTVLATGGSDAPSELLHWQ